MRVANKVRVIGGNLKQAHQFIQDLMLPTDLYVVASGVDVLRGLHQGLVILVGTVEDRNDFGQLMAELDARNIRVLAKIRDW